MDVEYPHNVEIRKITFCGLLKLPQFVNSRDMSQDAAQYLEIGARLAAVRTAFSDLSQKAWAEKHGFSPTQYNNWEKGVRRIPVDESERLCNVYGLTLDFIYRGRRDGLSETALKIL
ncbi:MAG: helix-turn-helix transcriptional regulator [Rhodobacteraceae bacterium]|nr:helix-turn-helix transcriptional regulator [Paracoccaceae bacterium]